MNKISQAAQKRKPTDLRKHEIIDAALNILAHNGVRSFTAKNIATEVGISSGAIFRYVESITAIIVNVVARIERRPSARIFRQRGGDPLERLKLFFLNRTRTVRAHPNISRLLLSDQLDQVGGGEAAEMLKRIKCRTRNFIDSCIIEIVRAAPPGDTAGTSVDIDVARVIIIGAILSMFHSSTRVVDKTKSPQLAADVWRALERILRTQYPRANRSGFRKRCPRLSEEDDYFMNQFMITRATQPREGEKDEEKIRKTVNVSGDIPGSRAAAETRSSGKGLIPSLCLFQQAGSAHSGLNLILA